MGRSERELIIPERGEIPLALKIDACRRSLRMSAPVLAMRSKCSTATISRAQNPHAKSVSVSVLDAIARALGFTDINELKEVDRATIQEWIVQANSYPRSEPLNFPATASEFPMARDPTLIAIGAARDQLLAELHRVRSQLKDASMQIVGLVGQIDQLDARLDTLERHGPHQSQGTEPESRRGEAGKGTITEFPEHVRFPNTLEQVIDRAIKLLERLSRQEPAEAHIYIANLRDEIFEGDRGLRLLRERWWDEVRRALDAGWHVAHIVHLNDRREAVLPGYIPRLLGSRGRYEPVFLENGSGPNAGENEEHLILIPNAGALSFSFSQEPPHKVAGIHLAPGGEDFETSRSRFANLRSSAAPLLTIYEPYSAEFRAAMVAVDRMEGERFVVMNGLSEVTIPTEINELRAGSISNEAKRIAAQDVLDARKQRRATFLNQIRSYSFRDIVPAKSIERFAELGDFPRDDALTHLRADAVPNYARARYLKDLAKLLRDNPNYQLGLLGDDAKEVSREFILVKNGQGSNRAVIAEIWVGNAEGDPKEYDLEIRAAELVEGYYRKCLSLWDDGHSMCIRDKGDVIAWLLNLAKNI